jgi:hypothetical protein
MGREPSNPSSCGLSDAQWCSAYYLKVKPNGVSPPCFDRDPFGLLFKLTGIQNVAFHKGADRDPSERLTLKVS